MNFLEEDLGRVEVEFPHDLVIEVLEEEESSLVEFYPTHVAILIKTAFDSYCRKLKIEGSEACNLNVETNGKLGSVVVNGEIINEYEVLTSPSQIIIK